MNLDKHISELLFDNDCVIVPGFGGFVCNHAPARINAAQHVFYPPSKHISFNISLKNNDGLLANQVSQAEKISFAEANDSIREFVSRALALLKLEKRLELKNIGILFLDAESNIRFEPDLAVNYLPDSFGMTVIQSPAIKRETTTQRLEKKPEDRKMVRLNKEKEEAKKGSSAKVWIYSAAASVLVIGFTFIYLKTDLIRNINFADLNPFASKEKAAYVFQPHMLPAESTKSLPAISSINENYSSLKLNAADRPITVQMMEADKTFVRTTTSSVDVSSKKYFIIGGCFEVPENAERFLQTLLGKGYPAAKLSKLGRLTPVCYNGFATRQEADAELARIKAADPNAWLLAQ